jgi:predicted Zn-dependent peptidase
MRLLVLPLLAAFALHGQAPRLTDVQERRLANGARLLLVERRGMPAFHAALVFRGGRAEEPAALAGATDLLARCLFTWTLPEDLAPGRGSAALEPLLVQEDGLLEALRLERLRQRRDPAATTQVPELEAQWQALQKALRPQGPAAPLTDLYAARGGRQTAQASPDALLVQTELPTEAFEFWCRTEAQRLRSLPLSRFAETRATLVAELRATGPQGQALLRGAALPGHPYGRELPDHLPGLEGMRRADLRSFAHRALGPERLTVILVGSLGIDQALALVDRHLGALPATGEAEDALLPEIQADLGDRRVQASLGGKPSLLAGWRIPPRSHTDHLALRMAAQLLGGGTTGRLGQRLVRQKGLARRTDVSLDLTGARFPGLFEVDLDPAEGHSLAELESALHGEILRLHQEPISPNEWERALAQLEVDHLRRQDDPADLTRALALAWAQTGDWRADEAELRRLRTLGPEAVQATARTWLRPSHRTLVWLEMGAEGGLDPLEVQTAKVLKALAATRLEDLAQREHLVAEGLRQLRMLSPEERARTLKLLEAQLPPEKR